MSTIENARRLWYQANALCTQLGVIAETTKYPPQAERVRDIRERARKRDHRRARKLNALTGYVPPAGAFGEGK